MMKFVVGFLITSCLAIFFIAVLILIFEFIRHFILDARRDWPGFKAVLIETLKRKWMDRD